MSKTLRSVPGAFGQPCSRGPAPSYERCPRHPLRAKLSAVATTHALAPVAVLARRRPVVRVRPLRARLGDVPAEHRGPHPALPCRRGDGHRLHGLPPLGPVLHPSFTLVLHICSCTGLRPRVIHTRPQAARRSRPHRLGLLVSQRRDPILDPWCSPRLTAHRFRVAGRRAASIRWV
jgi:hypothetical protein